MHIGVPGTRARVGVMCGHVVVAFSVIVDATFEQNSFFFVVVVHVFHCDCGVRSALCPLLPATCCAPVAPTNNRSQIIY